MEATPPTIDDLLVHEPFLRRLAQGLVGNSDLAEEAVQDTWLVALRRPPEHAGNLRGWLGSVLRNVARDRLRRHERARRVHERLGVEQIDARRASLAVGAPRESARLQTIGEAVLALPEPYRTVLLLRFYYDYTRPEIAALLGRPLNTVNSQLLRGLDRLRADLDQRCGSRDAWSAVLLAAAGPGSRWSPFTAGVGRAGRALARAPGLWGAAAVVVTITSLVLWRSTPPRERGEETIVTSNEPAPAPVPAEPATPELARRAAAIPVAGDAGSGADATNPVATAPESPFLDVTVVDRTGASVSGADIQMVVESEWVPRRRAIQGRLVRRGTTDAEGRARIDLEPAAVSRTWPDGPHVALQALAPGRVASTLRTVGLDAVDETTGGVPVRLVVGGPDAVLRGHVRDADGNPLARATVHAGAISSFVPRAADGEGSLALFDYTDQDGAYEIRHLEPGRVSLRVTLKGYVGYETAIDVTDCSSAVHDVRLATGAALVGAVRTPDGRPAAGARVWVQWSDEKALDEVAAGPDGSFALRGVAPGTRRVWAEHATARALCASAVLDLRDGDEHVWEPVLERRESLRLRLVSAEGAPLVGWLIWVMAPAEGWGVTVATDAEGRIELWHLPDGALSAQISPPDAERDPGPRLPVLSIAGLAPSPEERVVVVPPERLDFGAFRGYVVGLSALPPGSFELKVKPSAAPFYVPCPIDPDTGEFEAAEVPPGGYDLYALTPGGLEMLAEIEVFAGQTSDTGALVPAPRQRVSVDWRWPRGDGHAYRLVHEIVSRHGVRDRVIDQGQDVPAGWDLMPGRFGLEVLRGRELLHSQRFDVVEGQPLTLRTGP